MIFNNAKAFKAIDMELIKKFDLKDLKSEFLDSFSKNREHMTLFDYNESASGLYNKFMKMQADDLFEFLLLCLTKSKDEVSEVELDEESYSISFKYAGKHPKIHMAIDLFKESKDTTVINFRKESGCIFKY